MRSLTVLTCIAMAIVAFLTLSGPVECLMTLRPRGITSATTAPITRKERLPYTPVKDSTRKERLPYTPPKTTTSRRPGSPIFLRTTTTRRVPFPPAVPRPPPCDCKCDLSDYRPLCATVEGGSERTTFVNRCQLNCQKCLDNKRYQIVMEKECNK